ncbi:MAG: hypothetical protein HOL45_00445 [Chloroflexi bacterium]|nr:hypothetical protein [Chloroflexota bacterium]
MSITGPTMSRAPAPERPSTATRDLDPSDAVLDDEVQSRENRNTTAIKEFAEAIEEGAEFPPIVVFYDGGTYWCADGFHQTLAIIQAKTDTIRKARSAIQDDPSRRTRRSSETAASIAQSMSTSESRVAPPA